MLDNKIVVIFWTDIVITWMFFWYKSYAPHSYVMRLSMLFMYYDNQLYKSMYCLPSFCSCTIHITPTFVYGIIQPTVMSAM
jgi:hypothetical protein